jgi:hypothetical protein
LAPDYKKTLQPGGNPTILRYNSQGTDLKRYESKNIFFYFENTLACYKDGVVVAK